MAVIKHNGIDFAIDDKVIADYKELIDMVLVTDSMDDEQRQYWFDVLPSMPDFQIDNLYEILDNERKELERIEREYQSKVKDLNKEHLIKWQKYQSEESRKKVAEEEKKDQKNDWDADAVLSMLDDL